MRMIALPFAAAGLAAFGLSGCKDHGAEIRALQDDLVAAREALEESDAARNRLRADTNARIEALQDRLESLALHPLQAREVETLRAEVAELKAEGVTSVLPAIEKRFAEVEARVDRVKGDAAASAAAKVAEMRPRADDRAIAAAVERALQEREKYSKPTKNFDEAFGRLNISDAEKLQLREEVKKTKKEMLELLETPMTSGRIPAEEVIDTILRVSAKDDGAHDRFAKLLRDLSTEIVPGDPRGRTYVAAIEEIKKTGREAMARMLSAEDQRRLDAAHKDWSEFEIGPDDPWGPIYAERLDKYNREKK